LNFTLVNSLILAGIIQGFVFGIMYLFSKKYKHRSTSFLALLIITFSYNNLQFYLQDADVVSGLAMYYTIYIPVGSLIPVFIYFYTVESTIGLQNRFKKPWLFFIPFIVFLSNALFFKIFNLVTIITQSVYQNFKISNDFQSVFAFVYTLVLIVLSYRHLVNYEKDSKIKKLRSYRQNKWFKNTLVLLFFLSLFWSIALVMYFTSDNYRLYFNLLWIGLSIVIYWLGHIGIYKYGITQERKKIRTLSTPLQDSFITETRATENIIILKQKLIEQQLFLEPKLTLEAVANEIGMSKSHLSRIFNKELKKSFSDYINELRVNKAQSYLENPDFSNYTLLAIGLEAGFNSKTTFNTVFKKFTNMTPSQYRNSNLQEIEHVTADK